MKKFFWLVLAAVQGFGAEVYWLGGDGDWNDGTKWSTGAAPGEGDSVRVAGGGTVVAGASTARLAEFAVEGATLVASNWTTRLRAASFRIGEGGVVTCAGGFTNDMEMAEGEIDGVASTWYKDASRVWIECVDLTVEAGGAIDVTGKGFKSPHSGFAEGWVRCKGAGPGAGTGRAGGAVHGGGLYGGATIGETVDARVAVGDAERPELPGSSGGAILNPGAEYAVASGGGVVRVRATGKATVDGKILADAERVVEGQGTSGGAGGSIWLECGTLEGVGGEVSADGGASCTLGTGGSLWRTQGSGGRIAVHYGEVGARFGGMKFDARTTVGMDRDGEVHVAQNERGFNRAEPGTVWFTDGRVFGRLNGAGICGRVIVPGCEGLRVEGDFAVEDELWFGMTNFTFEVTGNLTVGGVRGCLAVGVAGGYPADLIWAPHLSGTNSPCRMAVGGDLLVTGRGRVFAAPTYTGVADTEDGATGGRVDVAGDVKLEEYGTIEAASEPYWGSSVVWTMRDLTVGENAKVTADWMGGWYKPGEARPNANSYVGGGYGGTGGNFGIRGQRGGETYGDEARPYLPGAGGGMRYGSGRWVHGGGAVRMRARGVMRVDGRISADGRSGGAEASAASGGGILLECRRLEGTGRISAVGGDMNNYYHVWMDSGLGDGKSYSQMANGGGGRVAVWTGHLVGTEGMTLKVKEAVEPRGGWAETIDVSGGKFAGGDKDPATHVLFAEAGVGTVAFRHVDLEGMVIVVR